MFILHSINYSKIAQTNDSDEISHPIICANSHSLSKEFSNFSEIIHFAGSFSVELFI
jgi:hypothetical protein